jgi:hypothetical protein
VGEIGGVELRRRLGEEKGAGGLRRVTTVVGGRRRRAYRALAECVVGRCIRVTHKKKRKKERK